MKDGNQYSRHIVIRAVYYWKLYLWKLENCPRALAGGGLCHDRDPPTLFRGFGVRGILQSSLAAYLKEMGGVLCELHLKSGEVYSCLPSGCITNPSRDSQAGTARSRKCLATWTYNCKIHVACTHFRAFSNAFQLSTKPWDESSCLAFTTYADAFIKNFLLFDLY